MNSLFISGKYVCSMIKNNSFMVQNATASAEK